MSVKINPIIDHKSYDINGHSISKDIDGNWNCEEKLSHEELYAFAQYENLVIKNHRFKKHIKTTYNANYKPA